MKFSRNRDFDETLRCTYDVVDATETLLAAVRRSPLGEKIAVEPHLRAMWNDAGPREQVVIAAIVSALELPPKETPP